MGLHATFSTGLLKVSYAGVDLSDGKAADGFLSISRGSPRFTTEAGLDGFHATNISLDNSATITLTYFVVSEVATTLKNLYQIARINDKQQAALLEAPFIIKDPSNKVLFAAEKAALMNNGDEEYGSGAPTVSFDFFIPDLTQASVPEKVAGKVNSIASDLGIGIAANITGV